MSRLSSKLMSFSDAFAFLSQEEKIHAVPTIEVNQKLFPQEIPDFEFVQPVVDQRGDIWDFCSPFILPLHLLSSCQVYRAEFDCQPGYGVPCTSVTDIEKMIVETPDNSPDTFLGYLPSKNPACVKSALLTI